MVGFFADAMLVSGKPVPAQMVVNMLGVVAQWEHEAISERTAFALYHKRANLQAYGRAPYGYRREGLQLNIDDKQQATLKSIRLLWSGGSGSSYRTIARKLKDEAIAAPKGRVWHASSVRASRPMQIRNFGAQNHRRRAFWRGRACTLRSLIWSNIEPNQQSHLSCS